MVDMVVAGRKKKCGCNSLWCLVEEWKTTFTLDFSYPISYPNQDFIKLSLISNLLILFAINSLDSLSYQFSY